MSIVLKPAQAIKQFYKREPVEEAVICKFRDAANCLVGKLDIDKSEENAKGFLRDFLTTALYPASEYNVQQDYHGIDLTIHRSDERQPQVLFETKGVGKAGMVSKETLCRKAMYEIVLYYIREEFKYKNHDIKHLVITDFRQFFIFEKAVFYSCFGSKRDFVRRVLDADSSNDTTDYIYGQIIKPQVEQAESEIKYTYLNISEVMEAGSSHRSIEMAYKLLSPAHIFNFPFSNTDHNTLNTQFYNELLYIMGVGEAKAAKVKQIVRLPAGKRQEASLLEQTLHELECYSISSDERRFDVAIGLVINWINRILFLKLLESRLVSWNQDGHQAKILTPSRIADYYILNDLFWHVLAKTHSQRSEKMRSRFADVPYLNSSLFEVSGLEREYFRINSLNDKAEMDIMPQTVLRDGVSRRRRGRIRTLDYLLEFLDAYDFGASSPTADDAAHARRTLIDASVLGLIFEKINGYKEGSFFTPGYITEYICRTAIRSVAIDRLNERFSLSCHTVEELKECLDVSSVERRDEINDVINHIRVCDPAVGSGHFLVSALNEFIALKSRLGVLQYQDDDHTRLPLKSYSVEVADDELSVRDAFGNDFCYVPTQPESMKIQRMLFEEKKTIIENCLFGVDVNPKSVEICRLRLWIELLKNAYYFRDETGMIRLQTLPNIDLNIKTGDSLASRIPVRRGKAAHSSSYFVGEVEEYKRNVAAYKNCDNKKMKQKLGQTITNFRQSLLVYVAPDVFQAATEPSAEQLFWRGAMEWMIEFPDILDKNGAFMGFDLIVGNPPYIPLHGLKATPYYRKMLTDSENSPAHNLYSTLDGQGDIYSLFVERALQLLKQGGLLSFIIPNKWMQTGYGKPLRRLFCQKQLVDIVDFVDNQVFDAATTYTAIVGVRNNRGGESFAYHRISRLNPATLPADIESHTEIIDKRSLGDTPWTISSGGSYERIRQITGNPSMTTLGQAIGDECYFGILTGRTHVFNEITPQLRERLVSGHPNARDLLRPSVSGRDVEAFRTIRPRMDMLFIPKGFTLKGMKNGGAGKPAEAEAWAWFSRNYPSVADYLRPHADACRQRDDKGDYWWELRACDYYDRFEQPKIYYQAIATRPCFVYDEGDTICNNSMFIISTSTRGYEALFNSAVGWWLICAFCPLIRGGRQLSWNNLRQVPVPKIMPSELGELAIGMREAVDAGDMERQNGLMARINSLCASIYGLAPGELEAMAGIQ